jgi:hypothetical protein
MSFTVGQDALQIELSKLLTLAEKLKKAISTEEKISILDKEERVWEFCAKTFFPKISLEEELVIKSIVAIGQHEKLLSGGFPPLGNFPWMKDLLQVQEFYKEIGGIIGYQLALLEFLCEPKKRFPLERAKYHAPKGYDLSNDSQDVRKAVYYAIENMQEIAEMYPLGGAADRLKLQDPKTKEALPAALLMFSGQPMLEHLIQDVQAREYLYYKVKQKQICIPIAMMTSQEKDNHQKVLALCEENQWFFRSREKFFLFCQPLVPVIDKQGNWVCSGKDLLMKPGGHGVMWKLAKDLGVISWLQGLGAKKAIIRQINNPISSEDYGILAFSGYGLKENRRFGFASCERQVKASEGVNVIVEEETENGFSYTLTSIEYCDFKTYGIEDVPASQESVYSKFPSNTNLLFADLGSIVDALSTCPIPGMLANFKKVALQGGGEEEIGRLESTMQNVADCFSKYTTTRLEENELIGLDAYITFNRRRKTISVTKKEYNTDQGLLETPEGCFLDVLRNRHELLVNYCNIDAPAIGDNFQDPPFLFSYHPALGPLYSVIGQKIQGGSLSFGSDLCLQIAECAISELHLDGSLQIIADQVMGDVDAKGIFTYSERVGRCVLKNVTVRNAGIDRSQKNVFWRGEVHRKESLRIILKGRSELYAENVSFQGDLEIFVEDGFRLTIEQNGEELIYRKEKIVDPSWHFSYQFSDDYSLKLEKLNSVVV